MNIFEKPQFPIIDSHIHYAHPDYMSGLMSILDQLHIQRLNIVCTPDQQRLSLVPEALHLKSHYPERVFVFGGLDISPLYTSPETAGQVFADYVDTLLGMGCDGIKMLEGKPQMRKRLPLPDFDSDIYAPYWARMAERQVPLVFHVNDPEQFWDDARIPDWARQRGWYYGDGAYINNEEQYSQVLNVLKRHPDLKVIFAHFFFLSAQLERLGSYLDRYPNMCVDLTPGIEMYHNFSDNPQQARQFFINYQDRILYGTDIGAKALLAAPVQGIEPKESQWRVLILRSTLECQGEFSLPPGDNFLFGDRQVYHGLNLPERVLKKIYYQNFERLVGPQPRPLDPEAIVAECERLTMNIAAMSSIQTGEPGDASIAQMVKSYFQAQLA